MADTSTGRMCSLTHPLYGEVVLDALGVFERARLTGELVDLVAGTRADDDDTSLLLTRLRIEADRKVSPAELCRAAEIANDTLDYRLAERLARRALEMQTHSGSTVALAWARLAQGHANEVAALLDEVEPDVMATGATSLQQRYVNTYFNAEFLALAHEDAAFPHSSIRSARAGHVG